jgi:hypothetical protein
MSGREIEWGQVRDFYAAGHTLIECQERFDLSDWDWHAAVGRGDVVPRTKGPPVLASKRRALILGLRSEGSSYKQISQKLGISKAAVAYHVRRAGMPSDDRCARRYDWPKVQALYDTGLSVRECAARFGFTTSSWHKAVERGKIVPRPTAMPLEELLVNGCKRGRWNLRNRLIKAGLKENRCEQCGLAEWRGGPLSMALHHVNGNGQDNRVENLQLLCPNCHSQTPNFSVRNVRRNGASKGPITG